METQVHGPLSNAGGIRESGRLKRGLSTPVCPLPSRQIRLCDGNLSEFIQRTPLYPVNAVSKDVPRESSPIERVGIQTFSRAARQWIHKSGLVGSPSTPEVPSAIMHLFKEKDKEGIIGLLNDFTALNAPRTRNSLTPGSGLARTPVPFTPPVLRAHFEASHASERVEDTGNQSFGEDEDILELYRAYEPAGYLTDAGCQRDLLVQMISGSSTEQLEVVARDSMSFAVEAKNQEHQIWRKPLTNEGSAEDLLPQFELEAMTLSNVDPEIFEISAMADCTLATDAFAQGFDQIEELGDATVIDRAIAKSYLRASYVHKEPKTVPPGLPEETNDAGTRSSEANTEEAGKTVQAPLCCRDEKCTVDHGLRKQRAELDRARKALGLREIKLKRNLYECPTCKGQFQSCTVARRHVTTHFDPRPYHCIYCHGKFSRDDALLRHIHTRCRVYNRQSK